VRTTFDDLDIRSALDALLRPVPIHFTEWDTSEVEHSLADHAGGAMKEHLGWTTQDSFFPERAGSNGVMVRGPKAVQADMKPRDVAILQHLFHSETRR
jgi:hypothetical protein